MQNTHESWTSDQTLADRLIPQALRRKRQVLPSKGQLDSSSSGCLVQPAAGRLKGQNFALEFVVRVLEGDNDTHLCIPLFAQFVFLLLGQEPHGHAQQVVIVWPTGLLLLCFILLLILNCVLIILRKGMQICNAICTGRYELPCLWCWYSTFS